MAHARLVVFDLDGTLIDSRQDLADAVNATLRHFGKPNLPTQAVASYVGDGAVVLIQRAFQNSGLPPQLLAEGHEVFLTFYKQHKLDKTYVYPGVLEALEHIHRQSPDMLMACLTNKPVVPARQMCDALALTPFFFRIYGGDSFPTKKPDPHGLHHLIAEAADERIRFHPGSTSPNRPIDAASTIMVGDGRADILAARAAGTMAIGCRFGFAQEDFAPARPDAVVTSPREWVHLLSAS